MRIGVISDTHGRIREKALEALKGSDLILHAGDVGGKDVLDALEDIAPVYAVRGNTDRDDWARGLPLTQAVEVGDKLIYAIHNIDMMDIDAKAADIDIVVYGHSHNPKKEEKKGVLYFNPGSAGPKRFGLPICLGIIEIIDGNIEADWIDLEAR